MRPATVKSREFDNYVEKLMKEWKVPGLALAVVDGEQTVVKNYGFADIEEGRPMDNETLFDCASTSKSFTAAAVALVLKDEQKVLHMDEKSRGFGTPVKKFLPDDFVLSDPYYTESVTVEDILSHRSGMPRHDDSYLGIRAKEPDSPRSVTRNLRNLPVTRSLRTTYQYCNMMYTVATHLVQEVSRVPFATFLTDRIWKPLGMDNTYLDIPGMEAFSSLRSQMATGYYWSEKEEKFKSVPFFSEAEALGAGSIFSTVSDYAKWLRCMLTKASPLSEASHEELVKPRIIADPGKAPKYGFSHTLYALGWETLSYRGQRIIGHDGCVSGFNSTMSFLPDMDWGIVVFCTGNEGAADCHQAIVITLIDDLIGAPAAERLDWNEIIREQCKKDKEEYEKEQAKEDEPDSDDEQGESEPAQELALEAYAGIYHNKGYHTIRLRLQEDLLTADCTDRSFPSHLDVRRKKGNYFTAKLRSDLDSTTKAIKVRFELGRRSGEAVRLGVRFEEEMDGELIWFDRVADADPDRRDRK